MPLTHNNRLLALLPTVTVLAVAALLVTYLMSSTSKAERTRPERSARLVEVATITPGDHPITVEAWGTVEAARRITLQSQVGGEVQAMGKGFEPGAHLKKGDLLLRIDPADYELAVRQRRSELVRARAELALEQGRRSVAEQEFAMLGSEVTAEQQRLILRGPQLDMAKAAVASAEAALAKAELDLARTTVEAPFDALVLERAVDLGARVSNGGNIANLAATDAFWVELAVPATTLPWLEIPGARVRLQHEAVWGKQLSREGRVIGLRGDLDDKGRMARLLVEVSDPLGIETGQPRLLLGAFLRAEIAGRPLADVAAIDRAWLRDGDTLWLMDSSDRLAIRPVEVVYRAQQQVFVRDGIAAGERVVTSNLAVPAAGMPLRVPNAGDEAGDQ